jgi:hypothetical protein
MEDTVKNHTFSRLTINITAFLVLLAGCAGTSNKVAFQLSKESLKNRQLQTRYFNTDEKTLLSASAAVLQDLGFNINESETDLGVIVCSKQRDATTRSQLVAAIVLAMFTGVVMPTDTEQSIRASLITRPMEVNKKDPSKCRTSVRITFQRIVKNDYQQITRREQVNEVKIYQEFFDKLSHSLFLEAHKI